MSEPAPRKRASGLFRRIYLGFLLTLVGFLALAALGMYLYASVYAPSWVENANMHVADVRARLDPLAADRDAMHAEAEVLEKELGLQVRVFHRRDQHDWHGSGEDRGSRRSRRGRAFAPPHLHRREHMRDLRAGRTVIARPSRYGPPGVYFAIENPERGGRMAAVVGLEPNFSRSRLRFLAGLGIGLLGALGAGAYVLARGLTGRLQLLERSADRIAGGDLQHRVDMGGKPARDELDAVGQAFNDMADQVETLLQSQRTLLANVSHELRTPIARMKVLLEILGERTAGLPPGANDDADRIRKGLGELGTDVTEVETLISDLLTSGKLELAAGSGHTLSRELLHMDDLAREVARKFDARVDVRSADTRALGDRLMLQRLLSNLLANGRRACPDGDIVVQLEDAPDSRGIVLAVEDCGPGVAEDQREVIFEPFRRLDAARARDQGGVGLGLYLCRQIARAHGGSIHAEARPDGKSGARFVLTLPTAGA